MNQDSSLTATKSLTMSQSIMVSVETEFIATQMVENESNYVFSYTISIANNSDEAVKLLSRYWLITDADNKTSTVTGEGVIGKQPVISPDETYTYTSGCILKTPVGTMQGHYMMLNNDNSIQQVEIPVFGLAQPLIVN